MWNGGRQRETRKIKEREGRDKRVPQGPAGPEGPAGAAAVIEADAIDSAAITGVVVDASGEGVEAAVVSIENQDVTATTASDGSFELSNVAPGFVYLYVTAPSEAYLDGETLQAIHVEEGATVPDVSVTLSGRPSADATAVRCAGCHSTGAQIEYQDFVDGDVTFKSVVTAFDYKDLNMTCEACHGPGSDHMANPDKATIISPQYLTAKASNELCGQCHASHAGKSEAPMGIFKYAFDERNKDGLGNGYFVPGVYDLSTYYFNYNLATLDDNWKDGPFHAWPDQTHSRAHSQQLPELLRSAHLTNPYEKLTCYTCHDPHALDGGPASLVVDGYDFQKPAYSNNTLCLTCHATQGPFESILKDDVAVLQVDAGGTVLKDGEALAFEAKDAFLARNRVASAVGKHMQVGAGMGGALYTPDNLEMPVGSCTSCHMAQIGKLQDVNDDAQYYLALDSNGLSAVAQGNLGSHVFDIVWPGQSSVLRNPDPAAGHDYGIMPNSCSACHDFARISGDID